MKYGVNSENGLYTYVYKLLPKIYVHLHTQAASYCPF